MKGELYKITNIHNGKIYIGKTYIGYLNRWNRHVLDAIRNDRNNNYKFANAIRKYGKDAFKVEKLLDAEEDVLEQKEVEYINLYDSYNNGYNSTLGGEGNTTIHINEQDVIEMFKNGASLNQIAKEIGTKTTRTISAIIKKNGLNIQRQTKVIVHQYDNFGNMINTFDSKMASWEWLVLNYKSDIKKSTAYYYIKKASETGGVAFGYRWKQIETDEIATGESDNFNKYTYYCNVYDKNKTSIFKDARVIDVAKMLVDKGLTDTDNYKSVRSLIINIGTGWIYNLYFEVYKTNR